MVDDDPSLILHRQEPVTDQELIDAAHEVAEVAREQAKQEATGYGMGSAGPTDEDMTTIDEMVEWIVPCYEDLLTPLPADFDVLAEAMAKIAGQLVGSGDADAGLTFGASDLGAFQDASRNMEEWGGQLADDFRRDYLGNFPAITSNQGKLAYYLRESATTMAQLYERRRRDALMNARYAVDALESTGDCRGADLNVLLAVTVSLGTLLSGAGAIWSETVTPPSRTSGIIGDTLSGAFERGTEEMPLAADTVDGVLHNLRQILTKSEEAMTDEEDELLGKLKDTERELFPLVTNKPDASNPVVPVVPELGGFADETVGSGGYFGNDPPE